MNMGTVFKAILLVVALWVGVEFFAEGPSRAFDGAFAGFFGADAAEGETPSTAQRAGDAVSRSQAEAEARRERMLGE
jgi:hypothetical protein